MALTRVGTLDAWVDPEKVSLILIRPLPESYVQDGDAPDEYEITLVIDSWSACYAVKPGDLTAWREALGIG